MKSGLRTLEKPLLGTYQALVCARWENPALPTLWDGHKGEIHGNESDHRISMVVLNCSSVREKNHLQITP